MADCPSCGGSLSWRETEGRKWLSCDSCFACFLPMRKGGLEQVVRGLGQTPTPPLKIPSEKAKPRKKPKKQPKAAKKKSKTNGQFPTGENHLTAKLTEKKVRTIRERLKNGEDPPEIAKKFSVALSTIHDIKTGRTWKGVGEGE